MKRIRRIYTFCVAMLLTLCVSCKEHVPPSQPPALGPYGYYIEEDLTTTNIIDDNYRNYYEIYVGSFYDSDGNGIGDLNGVTAKLDYIKDLGFNGIWLMPINEAGSYHKYDVIDYYAIDSDYGTMDDLVTLINECHKRGIKLIMDLVLNHSSNSNDMFNKAIIAHEKYLAGFTLTEEEEKYKDFYSFSDTASVPTGYARVPGKSFSYECNFSGNMPEFNCDSEYVREEFQNIINFYLDKGMDGFRLDAVKYFYFGNNAKCIELLSEINKWVKTKNPNAYVVGECWELSDKIISSYYESGIDSFFNFEASVSNPYGYLLNSINQEGRFCYKYYDGLLSNIKIAGSGIPAPFINNHDTPRYTSRGDVARSKFQFALLQMMNGSTFTYYGDEVGMVGTNTGTNPDQNVRIPILWGSGEGDCTPPGGTTELAYPYGNVNQQLNDKNSILNYYKKVLLVRNQNPEIARGEVTLVEMDRENAKLFVEKTYNGSEIGLIFNFNAINDLNVNYQSFGFTKVVGQIVIDSSEEKYIGIKDDGSLLLPPYSIAIVK
jgi:glycosidase